MSISEMARKEEERITDSKTGGQKGSKLARFDLIPPEAMWEVAEVYGRGAKKYADRNWEKGYAWGLSVASLERHLNAWKRGHTFDTVDGTENGPMIEGYHTGARHMAQVIWHGLCLLTFEIRRIGTDDRRGAV